MAKKIKGVTCIARNGSTYWYARVDGRRKYCGKDDKGKKLAEIARKKWEVRQYENREVSVGVKKKKTAFKTFNDLCNWYFERPKVQQQKIYKSKLSKVKHLFKFFEERKLQDIDSDEIDRYRTKREGEGAASGTIDQELKLLRTIYYTGRKYKKIHADLVPGTFDIRGEKNPRRAITKDEYEALLKHSDSDFQDVLVCAYESAMRKAEIRNLRAYQVNLDKTMGISGGERLKADFIDLGIFDTKTGARRTVPVSSKLREVLRRRLQGLDPEDLVFTNNGKKYWTSAFAERMQAACKEAEIPYGDKVFNVKGERAGIVFHCFRHTRTSLWVEMGFSDEIIRRATGHRSLDSYRAYVHLSPAAVMRLVEERHKNDIQEAVVATG